MWDDTIPKTVMLAQCLLSVLHVKNYYKLELLLCVLRWKDFNEPIQRSCFLECSFCCRNLRLIWPMYVWFVYEDTVRSDTWQLTSIPDRKPLLWTGRSQWWVVLPSWVHRADDNRAVRFQCLTLLYHVLGSSAAFSGEESKVWCGSLPFIFHI